MRAFRFTAFLLLTLSLSLHGKTYPQRGSKPFASKFFEPNYPFYEATVDLRGAGPAKAKDNLIPRAILIPLENGITVCFDTELLRVAGIWKGGLITPDSLAMRSYREPLTKQSAGQKNLPQPKGKVFHTTGLYPGWQKSASISAKDPRSRGLDERELGRGPLPRRAGRWLGVEDCGSAAVLHYQIGETKVRELFSNTTQNGKQVVLRTVELSPLTQNLAIILAANERAGNHHLSAHYVKPSQNAQRLSFAYSLSQEGPFLLKPSDHKAPPFPKKNKARWSKTANSRFQTTQADQNYALDELTFPYPNPWKRRIRPYAIDFFPNGDAVIVTFDGDVYALENLASQTRPVRWLRIAAGLCEPASIRVRNNRIFVFSRLGITELIDKDHDGETDFYKLVSNNFLQSAETRDYPMSLTPWEKDSWIITKGGQQTDYPSPHSGRVLQVPSNGAPATVWAHGLRNSFANIMTKRNLLVASDQQGNWVPATPFHILKKDAFHGFQPSQATDTPRPLHPPALWFPHRVARSGIDVLSLEQAKLGALTGHLLYLDYTLPSIHKVMLPKSGEILTQATAHPLSLTPETPILKGAVNPRDGLPYLVGFQIWDSFAKRLEGLCRIRAKTPLDQNPTQVLIHREGIQLSFAQALDKERALDASNYQVSSWNYQRTEKYGSGQFKDDGTPGVDSRFVHRVLLSQDQKSVFLAIKSMDEAMQYEVQYRLLDQVWRPLYLTANELPTADFPAKGFPHAEIDTIFNAPPSPRKEVLENTVVSVLRGQELSLRSGCIGCHSVDGNNDGKSGPTWKGLAGAKRKLSNGKQKKANRAYLRDAILEPNKELVKGFDGAEAGMPSYKGILSESELESIILYIESLK